MSALCPQCGNTLEQDFGVVSCPRCHSVLVIDLDGNIEIQDAGQIVEEIHDAIQEPEIEPIQSFEPIAEIEPEAQSEPEPELEAEPEIQPEPMPTVPLINTSGSIISYQISIAGIDTKEMREQLEDALKDPKFPWSAREIIQQIDQGNLEIGPLNPVTASVLVRRLKDLSLEIRWKQNIYE